MTKQEVQNTLKAVGLESRYSGSSKTLYVQGIPTTNIIYSLNAAAEGFSVVLDEKYAKAKKVTRSKAKI